MKAETLLLRQVHPNWLKEDGTAASIAFRPFPKDNGFLSVDDGDCVTAVASWKRFVAQQNCQSAGVWAFDVQEATILGLEVMADPLPENKNPDHVLVDFNAFSKKQQDAKAKFLSIAANSRGCLFLAS